MDLTPSRAATNETSVLLLDFDGSAHRSLSLGVRKDQYQVDVADSFKAAMDLRQGLVNTVKWFDESNILNSY